MPNFDISKYESAKECLEKINSDLPKRTNAPLFVAMFSQVWETPMLGFYGIGSMQETIAYTTVIADMSTTNDKPPMLVYFDGMYAYTVYNPNDKFTQDLKDFNLQSILYSDEYVEVQESTIVDLNDDTPQE